MSDPEKASSSSMCRAIWAISLLWFGSLASAGAAFLIQLILARKLSLADYGIFASSMATVTLFAPLAGFGVQPFWLKVFGEEGWVAQRWLKVSLRFVIITTSTVLVLLCGWVLLGPHDVVAGQILLLLLPIVLGTLFIELFSGRLQLEERYHALTLWQMSPNCFRLLGVLAVISLVAGPLSVHDFAKVYLTVALATSLVGVLGLRAFFTGTFSLKGHQPMGQGIAVTVERSPLLKEVVLQTWPFGLSGLFSLIFFQSDIILLQYLAGPEQAGIYNVAFSIMTAVYLLPSAIYPRFLLPKLHRWANHDRNRFWESYRLGNGAMLVLGVLAAVVIFITVPWLVPRLFGPSFQRASGLLMILAVGTPFRFIATNVGATLVTRENINRKVRYMAAAAAFNILLNIMLIPSHGARGAAMATVLSEAFLLVVYLRGARWHVFGRNPWVLSFRWF